MDFNIKHEDSSAVTYMYIDDMVKDNHISKLHCSAGIYYSDDDTTSIELSAMFYSRINKI